MNQTTVKKIKTRIFLFCYRKFSTIRFIEKDKYCDSKQFYVQFSVEISDLRFEPENLFACVFGELAQKQFVQIYKKTSQNVKFTPK